MTTTRIKHLRFRVDVWCTGLRPGHRIHGDRSREVRGAGWEDDELFCFFITSPFCFLALWFS